MKSKNGMKGTSFIVQVECVVNRSLVCEGGTYSQVRANPFEYKVDSFGLDMPD